jgi:hypothetical protein
MLMTAINTAVWGLDGAIAPRPQSKPKNTEKMAGETYKKKAP